jgi:hypothetical protein
MSFGMRKTCFRESLRQTFFASRLKILLTHSKSRKTFFEKNRFPVSALGGGTRRRVATGL